MNYRPTTAKSGKENVRDFWKATCKQSYSRQTNTVLNKITFAARGPLAREDPMPWHISVDPALCI